MALYISQMRRHVINQTIWNNSLVYTLVEEDRACCFTLIILWLSVLCVFSSKRSGFNLQSVIVAFLDHTHFMQ